MGWSQIQAHPFLSERKMLQSIPARIFYNEDVEIIAGGIGMKGRVA